MKTKAGIIIYSVILGLLLSCDSQDVDKHSPPERRSSLPVGCDKNNVGLILPAGFCAGIVADSLGFIRHLTVNSHGDIYVALRNNRLNLGGILALRDEDGDGRTEIIKKISDIPGMGIAHSAGHLYFASDTDIYRYLINPGQLLPEGQPDIIVHDLPADGLHSGKPFTIANDNHIYVNIGSASNACEQEANVPGSPGMEPCTELEDHAGIWRFAIDKPGQTMADDGFRFASGIRNAYAIDWHRKTNQLYVVQHGRDRLHESWPGIFTAEDGAQLPAEEFLKVNEGQVFGWPHCYFDPTLLKRVLAPEYGGDGASVGQCEKYAPPLIAFPAHYSPNDLKFYSAQGFPENYHNGAFIAFHGSYNRGEYEQVGYQVVFVPFVDGELSETWEVFADGFAGTGEVVQPEDADYRPTGLAIGPDGSLYIADSVQGRIWRIQYIAGKTDSATPDKNR